MTKVRKKLLTLITMCITCVICMFVSNDNVYAFGGDYTIKDPNGSSYSKEAPTQISISYDSSGNMIVSGYSYFLYVQQYLSKGTGANNTHYYRLKIMRSDNQVFGTYNDSLVGGDNYTSLALDDSYENAAASETIYCANGSAVNTSGTKKNTQLQQVSFKFVIPASDLKNLTMAGNNEYRLVLEHNMTNVKFKSTGSTKHKLTYNISKLIDANITQNTSISNNYSTDYGSYTVSVSAIKNFKTVRVNGNAVRLRTSSNGFASKSGTYNDGYFVKRGDAYADQRNILHAMNGSAIKAGTGLLGEYLIPLQCTYNKTSTSSVDMTLAQLFAKYPSLKNEYTTASTLAILQGQISALENIAYSCTNSSHVYCWICYGSQRYCPSCARANANELEKLKNEYDAKVARNAEIEAMCHTTSSSSTNVTATYYCKAMYVEADKNKDYYTLITVKQNTANIKLITRYQKENTNATTLGSVTNVGTVTQAFNMSKMSTGQNVTHLSSKVGLVIPTGYHIESVYDDYTKTKTVRSATTTITLPNTRNITVKGSLPVGQIIYVDYVFRNDAPKINAK